MNQFPEGVGLMTLVQREMPPTTSLCSVRRERRRFSIVTLIRTDQRGERNDGGKLRRRRAICKTRQVHIAHTEVNRTLQS